MEIILNNNSQSVSSTSTVHLSSEAIQDFQTIYLQEYGITISFEEAKELGTKFILLIKSVYKPLPKERKK